MASAQEYAAWLQSNPDLKGSEDYKTVERALQYVQQVPQEKPVERSADYKRGRTESGGMARGAMSVLNGPLLGFGDEVLGAAGGLYDTLVKGGEFGKNYRANRDYVRGAQDVESENNPWITGITQTALSAPMSLLGLPGTVGRAASMVGLPGVGSRLAARAAMSAKTPPMSVTRQAFNAAGSGALYGGASGAGNSTAEDLSGVAGDAAGGAAAGATLGGGAVPVVRGVMGAAGNVGARFSDSVAGRYAKEKVAQAFMRDATGTEFVNGISNPMDRARQRLNRLGEPAVLADAGGQNTRQLLDTMAMLPGATKQAAEEMIHTRQAGRAGRMIDAADSAMGNNGQRLAPTLQGLIDQRSAAASPLYDQLRRVTVQEPSPQLQEMVFAAHELGATSLGKQIAGARLKSFSLNPEMPFNWNMSDLDHVKRGLDQIVSRETNEAGKMSALGAAVNDLNTKLKNELDKLTTNTLTGESLYKKARDAFSGPSTLIDAAKKGKAAISQQEAGIQATLHGMSDSERHAFRVGAFEALREKLGGSVAGRTEVINMWQNPAMREKLQALFGSQRAFREFASQAAAEGRLKGLESVGRGSQTASRHFAAGDLDNPALEGAGSAIAGVAKSSPLSALAGAKNMWNAVKTPEAVRDEIGRILLSGKRDPLLPGPPTAEQNIEAIRDLVRRMNERRGVAARGMGLFMGSDHPVIFGP